MNRSSPKSMMALDCLFRRRTACLILIGLMVTGVWAMYAATIGVLFTCSIWFPSLAEAAVGLTEVMLKIVLPSFGGVILFYFGHRLVK